MTAPRNDQTIYISTGEPTTFEATTLYRAGELGHRTFKNLKWYRLVQVDSGPAAITAGDLAFWKDRKHFIVTNKLADAPEGRNGVAGVFVKTLAAATITALGFCLIQDGGSATVKASGTFAAGDQPVANSGAASDCVTTAAGTAPPFVPLGIAGGAALGGFVGIDLTLGTPEST